jgi:hypothetical protein
MKNLYYGILTALLFPIFMGIVVGLDDFSDFCREFMPIMIGAMVVAGMVAVLSFNIVRPQMARHAVPKRAAGALTRLFAPLCAAAVFVLIAQLFFVRSTGAGMNLEAAFSCFFAEDMSAWIALVIISMLFGLEQPQRTAPPKR